jgi:hypothetical protein
MSKGVANERRLDRIGPRRALRKRVIAEEPCCWLRLPGCTIKSDTADHVIPGRSARI